MKHILNDLTEQEKNAIREQHSGGMKVMTENFSKLLNSKLGDSKPLVAEQTSTPSPYTVGQVLTNIIRSVDKKPYTIKIMDIGQGWVAAKIKGPGTYEGKKIDGTGTYELNTNTPKKLSGNNELGDFMVP